MRVWLVERHEPEASVEAVFADLDVAKQYAEAEARKEYGDELLEPLSWQCDVGGSWHLLEGRGFTLWNINEFEVRKGTP